MIKKNCYINKNTKELRERLINLGYKLNYGIALGQYLVCLKIKDTNECFFVASPKWNLVNLPNFSDSIDCGENEDLFLSIVALRDDTEYGQMFYSPFYDEWILYDNGEICFDRWRDSYMYLGEPIHKASVDELIEHFKNK
jgi:hypothetical protein